MKVAFLIIFSLACNLVNGQFHVEYFGNMGVAISRNDSAIFIDAFHDFYESQYQPTFPEKLESVKNRDTPYRYAVVAMVTHYHDDHMDPRVLESVLSAHVSMKLVAGSQSIDRIDTTMVNSSRLIRVGQERVVKIAPGIFITAVKTWHVNYHRAARFANTENHFFLIEWNGRRFLHLGDTEVVDRNFEWLQKWKGTIDVLFVPAWISTTANGIELIRRYIEPRQTVTLHVSPVNRKSDIKSLIPMHVFADAGDALLVK